MEIRMNLLKLTYFLSNRSEKVTVGEIHELTRIPRSTIRNYLHFLMKAGFCVRKKKHNRIYYDMSTFAKTKLRAIPSTYSRKAMEALHYFSKDILRNAGMRSDPHAKKGRMCSSVCNVGYDPMPWHSNAGS